MKTIVEGFMIKVEHLRKDFKKSLKQPGLKGSIRSLIKPEVEIFQAVKDSVLRYQRGK